MLRYGVFFALALSLSSCQKNRTPEVTRFTPDGSLKPHVALIPVIDNSQSNLSWNVSDELTSSLVNTLQKKGKLFLMDKNELTQITAKLQKTQDPFSDQFAWVNSAFAKNDYAVFLELLEHKEEAPRASGSADVTMAMRLRIFDLRSRTPQIVLQEIIHKDHVIAKFFADSEVAQPDWGQEEFEVSPMGKAHNEFSSYVAQRIQQYIMLHYRG